MNHTSIGRKALYNSLRWHWLQNPDLEVMDWQVDDYSKYSLEEIFDILQQLEIILDRNYFVLYAENFDGPEDLSDSLSDAIDESKHDRVFLCIFELWKRLVSRKKPLTVFCDYIDHLIEAYDQNPYSEQMQELVHALTDLKEILDFNAEVEDKATKEVLVLLSEHSAHDLEAFLYDFITDQIDQQRYVYARELISDFRIYLDDKWVGLLETRLARSQNFLEEMEKLFDQLISLAKTSPSFEFNLELISVYPIYHDLLAFVSLVSETLQIIEDYADFLEVLYAIEESLNYLSVPDSLMKQIKDVIINYENSKNSEISFSLTPEFLAPLKDFFQNLKSYPAYA